VFVWLDAMQLGGNAINNVW